MNNFPICAGAVPEGPERRSAICALHVLMPTLGSGRKRISIRELRAVLQYIMPRLQPNMGWMASECPQPPTGQRKWLRQPAAGCSIVFGPRCVMALARSSMCYRRRRRHPPFLTIHEEFRTSSTRARCAPIDGTGGCFSTQVYCKLSCKANSETGLTRKRKDMRVFRYFK